MQSPIGPSALLNPMSHKTSPWRIAVARRSFVSAATIPVVLSTSFYRSVSAFVDTYFKTWNEVYRPSGAGKKDALATIGQESGDFDAIIPVNPAATPKSTGLPMHWR